MKRTAREITAELFASGLTPDQMALVTELMLATAADASAGRSKHAIAQAAYRERLKRDHVITNDHGDHPPHTPPSISSKPKRVSRSAVDVPDTPSDDQLSFAISKGWDRGKALSEWMRFRDWSLNKGRKHRDLNAAWRNWVTSPYQTGGQNVQTNQHHPGGAYGASKDRFREARADLKAFVADESGGGGGRSIVEFLPAARR